MNDECNGNFSGFIAALSNLERLGCFLSMVVVPNDETLAKNTVIVVEEDNGSLCSNSMAKTKRSINELSDLEFQSNDEGNEAYLPTESACVEEKQKKKTDEGKIVDKVAKEIPSNVPMSKFLSKLMNNLYSFHYMANHKMTGKGGDAKSSLDPKELEEIIAATKERYPNSKLSDIRLAIRYKLNNESKKYAASLAKKKSKN